jgi:hypothetical protein
MIKRFVWLFLFALPALAQNLSGQIALWPAPAPAAGLRTASTPSSEVRLMIDGKLVGTVAVDAQGRFSTALPTVTLSGSSTASTLLQSFNIIGGCTFTPTLTPGLVAKTVMMQVFSGGENVGWVEASRRSANDADLSFLVYSNLEGSLRGSGNCADNVKLNLNLNFKKGWNIVAFSVKLSANPTIVGRVLPAVLGQYTFKG